MDIYREEKPRRCNAWLEDTCKNCITRLDLMEKALYGSVVEKDIWSEAYKEDVINNMNRLMVSYEYKYPCDFYQ